LRSYPKLFFRPVGRWAYYQQPLKNGDLGVMKTQTQLQRKPLRAVSPVIAKNYLDLQKLRDKVRKAEHSTRKSKKDGRSNSRQSQRQADDVVASKSGGLPNLD
jgi:hypothetical protein